MTRCPGDLKSHILSVSESVIREGHKKKLPGPKVVEEGGGGVGCFFFFLNVSFTFLLPFLPSFFFFFLLLSDSLPKVVLELFWTWVQFRSLSRMKNRGTWSQEILTVDHWREFVWEAFCISFSLGGKNYGFISHGQGGITKTVWFLFLAIRSSELQWCRSCSWLCRWFASAARSRWVWVLVTRP